MVYGFLSSSGRGGRKKRKEKLNAAIGERLLIAEEKRSGHVLGEEADGVGRGSEERERKMRYFARGQTKRTKEKREGGTNQGYRR